MSTLKEIKIEHNPDLNIKFNLKNITENYFGNLNCYTNYDEVFVEKEFNNKKEYKKDYQFYSKIHNLDFLYVGSIKNYEKIKHYKDNYPLLSVRKNILLFIKYKKK